MNSPMYQMMLSQIVLDPDSKGINYINTYVYMNTKIEKEIGIVAKSVRKQVASK